MVGENSPRDTAAPLARQQSWLLCFCSVEFDLDVGQKMEHVVPQGALTTQEQSDIAFHAFPDSMSLELHACSSIRDSLFFVRTRRARLLYGFVFCRQRQDERLARGGDQRAVVVISEHPFSGILRPLAQLVGLEYFNGGAKALESIWEETKLWAQPTHTKVSQLLLRNHTLVTQLPAFLLFPPPAPTQPRLHKKSSSSGPGSRRSRSSLSRTSLSRDSIGKGSFGRSIMWDGCEGVIPMFNDSDLYGPFASVLPKLWALWELAITGEPLAIIAPTPGECSMAVASLISMISPVPYSTDFRPYYTIHDATFHELIMAHDSCQNGGAEELELEPHLPHLIGLTNLYFLKALPRWPNILSIGEKPTLAPGYATGRAPPKSRFQKFNPKYALQALRDRGLGAQVLLSQHVENLWMANSSLVRPDLELCKAISAKRAPGSSKSLNGTSRSDSIRKHFASLTAAFLEPFQGYFVPIEGVRLTDIPTNMGSCLPEFSEEEFFESLGGWPFAKALTDRVPNQRDLIALYERFVSSQNFRVWFSRHQKMVAEQLGLPHDEIKAYEEVPFGPKKPHLDNNSSKSQGAKPKSLGTRPKSWDCGDEVRLVEEFFRLEAELAEDRGSWEDMADDFTHIFLTMPVDLRQTLFLSPMRAELVDKLRGVPKAQKEIEKLGLGSFEDIEVDSIIS